MHFLCCGLTYLHSSTTIMPMLHMHSLCREISGGCGLACATLPHELAFIDIGEIWCMQEQGYSFAQSGFEVLDLAF